MVRYPALVLLTALLIGLASGCGDDDPVSGCRVLIRTSEADGSVDAPLFLVGTAGRFALEPTQGGEPGELFAPGAPDGVYRVEADGWGMLWVAARLPFFSTKATTPIEIPMGRGGTIYVGARDKTRGRVGDEWAVRRADGDRHAVAIEILKGAFELRLLRIPAAEYRGTLEVAGRMDDGQLAVPFEVSIGNPTRPVTRLAQPATRALVAVRLVELNGPPAGSSRVAVELLETPLPERIVAASEDGIAGITIADLERPIRIHLEDQEPAWSFDVDAAEVDRRGVYYVHAPSTKALSPVTLTGDRAADIDLVQVRGANGEAYGRVSLRPGTEPQVVVEPGKQRWLVRAGSDWAQVDVDVVAGEPVAIDGFEPSATASGTVFDLQLGDDRPVGPGHRLLFFRIEDDKRLLGEEMDVAVLPGGRYDARLPAGTYAVQVMRPHGQTLSDPVRVDVRPGMTLSRDFEIDAR